METPETPVRVNYHLVTSPDRDDVAALFELDPTIICNMVTHLVATHARSVLGACLSLSLCVGACTSLTLVRLCVHAVLIG
jgi:hypothetical protein